MAWFTDNQSENQPKKNSSYSDICETFNNMQFITHGSIYQQTDQFNSRICWLTHLLSVEPWELVFLKPVHKNYWNCSKTIKIC